MLDTGTIGRRYATALMMFVSQKGNAEQAYRDSTVLSDRLAALPGLRRVLSNPTLDAERKFEIARAFAGGEEVCDEFGRFLRLVIRQKRENDLLVILWMFQRMVREKLRLLDAWVITATAQDEATLGKISDELAGKVNATVDLHAEVDPSIIGGYILRWDTYRLDASVRGKLERLRTAMTEKQ
jgi:ATP synthase, F1 delta subunit